MDPMSKSMPTHPAAKGVLVDQYAQIALFDAEGGRTQTRNSTQLNSSYPKLCGCCPPFVAASNAAGAAP